MIKIKKIKIKILIFILLFTSCFIQTGLIYLDKEGKKEKLNSKEFKGLKIWKKNNCQSCHKIHGFGGFSASDITNKNFFFNKEILENVLKSNNKEMPIFNLKKKEITNLSVFLKYLNRTGNSKLINKNKKIPWFEYKNE